MQQQRPGISIPPIPPLKAPVLSSSSSSSKPPPAKTHPDESSSSASSSSFNNNNNNAENRSLNNTSAYSDNTSSSLTGSKILSGLDDSTGGNAENTSTASSSATATTTAAADGQLSSAQQLPDVTVRAYLESVCETLSNRIMEHARGQIKTIMDEFEAEKKLLLEDAEAERGKRQRRVEGRSVRLEIVNKKEALATIKSSSFAASFPSGELPEFAFELVPKKVVKLGRSRGAAFQAPRGVSLCWDDEVSTTHGHFVLSADGLNVCFVDVGSTNGTKLDKGGVAWEAAQKPAGGASSSTTPGGSARVKAASLEPNVAVVIEPGDVLYCGATKLRVKEVAGG